MILQIIINYTEHNYYCKLSLASKTVPKPQGKLVIYSFCTAASSFYIISNSYISSMLYSIAVLLELVVFIHA